MRGRKGGGRADALSCDAVRLALSAALDGESSDLPRPTVAAHMAGCEDCRQFEAGGRALQRRISLRASRQAPEVLKDLVAAEWAETALPRPLAAPPGRLMARRLTSRQSAPPHGWRRTARWAGALVPAAALVVILPLGALSAAQGTPTHASTPCTQNLRSSWAYAP